MATTRITNVTSIKKFTDVVEAKLVANSKFRQAGIVYTDPRISAKAATAGLEVTLREWLRPTGGSASAATDNPADKLALRNLSQAAMVARVIQRADGFSAMELADYASDSDAVNFAISQFVRLRDEDEQSVILNILAGIMADNAANDSGDMVKDTALGTGSILAANLLNQTTLINARATMGDMGGSLDTLIMHSDVVNYLRKQEGNAFVPASKTDIGLDTYLGYKVVETDSAPVSGSGTYAKYTTYLAGKGLFGYAPCSVDKPIEETRDPLAGNGSGEDTVICRWRYLMHPAGFDNATAGAGATQTNAELATAGTWDRKVARKAVPLVKIVTNIQ